ncbi:hypothetical protein [Prosthecobacter dejongeii]|uniref:Lipoprotein n=1 Tax=Prosthecobacter dejongeii TaxID=48465 RepID=A0A7W7YMN1_9BACT|nr:hypothetical protein [Prosthecobacter dejongeii]MBB5038842.1 hypothetical protein [Prosthecobacter dejongeii]
MKFSRLFTLGLATVALASCKTITSERLAFPNAPVSYQLVSDMVDEETIENTIKFRNLGQQIVSFDYTISDEPGIPHVDCLGPNSGLVENLYPGAEAKVKNPLDKNGEFVTLGRVTYGKRSTEELAKQYKPSTLLPATSTSGGASPLPVLEAVNAPGE